MEKGDILLLRATVEGWDGDQILLDFASKKVDPNKVRLSFTKAETFVRADAIKAGVRNYKRNV